MFDVGFWELIFIAIITLLVAGPERMPKIMRTAGLWLGKLRGFVSSVKQDIDRELESDELKAVPELKEFINEARKNTLDSLGNSPVTEADNRTPSGDVSGSVSSRSPDDQKK